MAAGLAGAALLLAFLFHLGVAAAAVAILATLPTGYLIWKALPTTAKTPPRGRPAHQWDPVELGVHPVIGGGPMPPYVCRPHDELLRAVLNPAVAASRLVVVRGGSSTGKTRAAYEAVAARLPDWQLDYPLDLGALVARLDAGIPARTALWLGELRHYADADVGVMVLGRLADLLEGTGHVLITTVWPEHWTAYTAAARAGPGAADPAGTAGRLLARLPELTGSDPAQIDPARGGVIDVPDRFTAADLGAVARVSDPLLTVAAAAAASAGQDGQVTQYLAGVPDLLRRYLGPGGDPYGQAAITAAMDATRLGHASPLPAALLLDAAVGYLSSPQRTASVESWRDTALAWATEELNGAVRAVQPMPPAVGVGVAGYQVADYLDQRGRRTRQDQMGPTSLWEALTVYPSTAGDLTRLGQAALDRGLYRHAAILWTTAIVAGSTDAAGRLIALVYQVSPGDAARAAQWAVTHASLDDPQDVTWLIGVLGTASASDVIQTLAGRAATRVSLDAPAEVGELLKALHDAGIGDAVTVLAGRVATQVSFDDPVDVAWLVGALREVGASGPIATVGARAVGQVRLDVTYPDEVGALLRALHQAGADDAVTVLADRVAAQVRPDGPRTDARLLDALREAGASDAIGTLGGRAAAQADLTYSHRVAELLEALRKTGASDAIGTLGDRVAQVSLDAPGHIADLLLALDKAGASDAVTALADRAAAQLSLDAPWAVARLLDALREVGAGDAIRTLLERAPADQISLDDPGAIAWLLGALREVGAGDAIRTLLERAPAYEVSLDDPQGFTRLLLALREAGASDAIRILADRAAVHISLDDRGAVAWLLGALREARASDTSRTFRTWLERDPPDLLGLDDPQDFTWLVNALREVGASDVIRILADQASLHDPGGVAELLQELRKAGADGVTRTLADRAATQVSLDNLMAVAWLLAILRTSGADVAVTALAARAVAHAHPDRPRDIATLLEALQAVKAGDAVRALLDHDPAAQVSLSNPGSVAALVRALAQARASTAVITLADRAAALASLDDPQDAAWLLRALRETATGDAVTVLAARAAAQVNLDDRQDVATLQRELLEARADGPARVLADRAANAGMFDLFLKANLALAPSYSFGREPDGVTSRPWKWQEPTN